MPRHKQTRKQVSSSKGTSDNPFAQLSDEPLPSYTSSKPPRATHSPSASPSSPQGSSSAAATTKQNKLVEQEERNISEVIKRYFGDAKDNKRSLFALSAVSHSIRNVVLTIITSNYFVRIFDEGHQKRAFTKVIVDGEHLPSNISKVLTSSPVITHVVFLNYKNNATLLPPSVKRLYLIAKNGSLENLELLHVNVTHLWLPSSFEGAINSKNLPSTLSHLHVSDAFDQPVDDLPASITHLRLGNQFQQELSSLPPSLLLLYTGLRCGAPINNLPPKLKYLRISEAYYGQIEGNLPKSITHLAWGTEVYQASTPAILPPNLERLMVNCSYRAPMFSLPSSLRHLSVKSDLPLDAKFKFPSNLTHFEWEGDNNDISLSLLPRSLSSCSLWHNFNGPIDELSKFEAMTELKFSTAFNQPVDKLLPARLSKLVFGSSFDQPVDHLPPNLKTLKSGYGFKHHLDHLPASLCDLHVGSNGDSLFNLPIERLPPNLQKLHFGQCARFDQPLDHLPANLQELTIGKCYKQPLCNLPSNLQKLLIWNGLHDAAFTSLPPHLTFLELSEKYNHPNLDSVLPASLIHLHIGKKYNHPIRKLPRNLEHLAIGSEFKYLKQLPPLPETLVHLTLMCPYHGEIANWPRRLGHLEYSQSGSKPSNLPPLCHVNKCQTWTEIGHFYCESCRTCDVCGDPFSSTPTTEIMLEDDSWIKDIFCDFYEF